MIAEFPKQPPVTVQETITWLLQLGRPPLPECPIEAAKQGREPKAPCFLDGKHLKSVQWKQWQNTQPLQEIICAWFAHPKTGIGTLGGWNGRHWLGWVDIDQKNFAGVDECERAIEVWLEQHPVMAACPRFRTPSGGYRFLIAFSREPEKFKATSGFSLRLDGSQRVGELLSKNGGHTLLPPTIGVNGKAYRWEQWCEYPLIVEQPEDVGLYPVQKHQARKQDIPSDKPKPADTTLSDFLNEKVYPILTAEVAYNWPGHDWKPDAEKLRGNCPWHESSSGTSFYVDPKDGTYAWRCPACEISGYPVQYRHRLAGGDGSPRGKAFLDIVRQLAADVGVEMPELPTRSAKVVDHPTAHRETLSTEELKHRIDALITQDLPKSELEAIIPDLASLANKQTRDVWALYRAKVSEADATEEREEVKKALPTLLEVKRQRLDPREFLWGDDGQLAKQLIKTAVAMPTAVGFLVTTLIAVCGSRIGTVGRIIVKAAGNYTQPAVYRTCIVAPSGYKKSPAQAVVLDALNEMEADKYKEWLEEQEQYKEDKAMYERELKNLKKGDEIPEPPAPPSTRKRYIITDSTFEALVRIHSENPRGLLVYRDEWSGHFTARNKYRGGAGDDCENELTEYNGSSLSKDRTKESLYLRKSAISRTGSTQNETLKLRMGEHDDFTGEFARWLFCIEDCPPSYLDLTSPGGDEDTGLNQTLRSLYERLEQLEEQDYFLSLEAKCIFQAYQNQMFDWTLAENQPGLKTAYPKFESYFARLALWLHIVNSVLANETPPQLIPGDTVAKASELTDYFIGQLRLIYAYNAPEELLTGRLLTIKTYVEGKLQGVTIRQIKAGVRALRSVPTSEITQDCNSLVTSGYLIHKDNLYFGVGTPNDNTPPPPPPPPDRPPNTPTAPATPVDAVDVLLTPCQQVQTLTEQGADDFVDSVDVENHATESLLSQPDFTETPKLRQQRQQNVSIRMHKGFEGVDIASTNVNTVNGDNGIALRKHVRTVFESGIDTIAKAIKFIPPLPHPILKHEPPTLDLV